ncbi:unnamed protein product [Rotaria socialis]|uniref:Uncharacterized protein n=1 Tax=Rotaria socialis TaxID=392032 RepID=A0A817LD06_9BILA|nr:unnamed protein product [Rotaria socialis]CAF3245143.1 unnamed protein product [Rotaria socialis]CAF3425178.1 unnamed protein product [Rotaria socialis]CAF3761278.1 unnamed protein product [Rotaria socialis]CAF4104880.1 unnamed protein product [Rotaria socialis]
MIVKKYFSTRILVSFVVVFTLVVCAQTQSLDEYAEDYIDDVTSTINTTLPSNLSTKMLNSSNRLTSLSSILSALSARYNTSLTKIKNNTNKVPSGNRSISLSFSSKSTKSENLSVNISSYVLVHDLVDQFNRYRNIDILSRIKQCNSNMKLSYMCETYSFDNHTHSLVRESNIRFQSLQHIYDSLIDRIIVQKLNAFCSKSQWCLGNLTKYNIRFTVDVFRQLGYSFCALEMCHHRLHVHVTTCPSITPANISRPTIALLPMLCTLYKEQQVWSSAECTDRLVYLLHILYAFWSQIETCYHIISSRSGGCTYECLVFDSTLREFDNKCGGNASFLTRVPELAWYHLINLQTKCRDKTIVTKAPLMSSATNFISSDAFSHRFNQQPAYAALFLVVIIFIVISFSLCLYFMSNNKYDSNTRNSDDGYEYTRLHNSTFELDTNTETIDMNSTLHRTIDQSQFDLDGNGRSLENHRLL